jgi:hypothetical protein
MSSPFEALDDPDELRRIWLNRYLRIQARYDTRFRTMLIQAAEDAQDEIAALQTSTTFSASVKTAQLRIVMKIIREVLKDLFGEILPVIKDGQKQSAVAAVDAFTETDRDFLEAAFRESSRDIASFIEGQKRNSMLGVANAVSREYQSDQPLSARVYRTRYMANRWVQNQVNSGILRGASAKEIAFTVRKSIRPNTSGGVAYAAMRLGRTELNNAFHATSIALAQDRPWVEGMRWNLSKTHDFDLRCICEKYANQVFTVEQVPAKPHPLCRCFTTPEVEAFDVFVRHLTAGQYNDWIRNAA